MLALAGLGTLDTYWIGPAKTQCSCHRVLVRFSMSALALVDHEGRVLTTDKPTTPSNVVEEHKEDLPLHVIAAREAERQSTKKHQ